MKQIDQIIPVAQYLGVNNLVEELQVIERRATQINPDIVLALVGEFNAGKTSIVNALTDNKALETDVRPTTSTIYEIHFGCDSCYATIMSSNGDSKETTDLSELKNAELTNAELVKVYDTSKTLPSSTILVDTPGLSSTFEMHQQTLVSFLPHADAILVVVDINQQLTRSLVEFIDTMRLTKRPIYLVLSKADTISSADIEKTKKHIMEGCNIPFQYVAVTSILDNKLTELQEVIRKIQKSKGEIIHIVDGYRTNEIVNLLVSQIDELMRATTDDNSINKSIAKCQYELQTLGNKIDGLIDSMEENIEKVKTQTIRKFEDTITEKLNHLINGANHNYDEEAIGYINKTVSLLMDNFRYEVQKILHENAMKQKKTDDITFASLTAIDLSQIKIEGLDYDINLNEMGHEHDEIIKTGLMAATAAGAAAVAVYTGGASELVTTFASAGLDKVMDTVDTLSDVGSIISNQKTANRIEKAVNYATEAGNQYQRLNCQANKSKGFVDSLVGLTVERVSSKPQRRRAISVYINDTLLPTFRNKLNSLGINLVDNIKATIQNDAASILTPQKEMLVQLQQEKKELKKSFEKKMDLLQKYKIQLLNL